MACRSVTYLVQPDEPQKLISVDDDAVDAAAMGPQAVEDFLYSTGLDRGPLVLIGEPTVFHVKPLSPGQYRKVKTHGLAFSTVQQRGFETALHAFDMSCKLIKNWEFPDGTRGDLPPEEWAAQVKLTMQAEVGRYVISMSTPQKAEVPKS